MKFHLQRCLLLCLMLLGLAACGIKGGLYLHQPKGAEAPKESTATPPNPPSDTTPVSQ